LVVNEQQFEGFWKNIAIIESLFGNTTAIEIAGLENVNAVITFLILKWIERVHPQK
jgi:hypothetical protein